MIVYLDAEFDLKAASYCACEPCVAAYVARYREDAADYAREHGLDLKVKKVVYGGPDDDTDGPDDTRVWQDIHDRVVWDGHGSSR